MASDRAARDRRRHERHPHSRAGSATRWARRWRRASEPTSTTSTREGSGGRFWDRLDQIPTDELWETHQRQKLELAIFARRRLRNQFARHGEAPAVLDALEAALDPDVLTIGFARRFATYKRAGLLFTDIDRLARLVRNEERPGPDRLRGQGPPRRPPRPAGHPGDLRPVDVGPAPRPRLHPRGLRHPDRTLPRRRRRRLAEQPAPAARGVGDERDEGGGERRGERQRPRRLVGRGLAPATTAGRSAAGRRTPTRAPRTGPTRRTSTGSSRTRSFPATTSATRTASRSPGSTSCGGRWRRRSGGSRRPGCSTTTSSGCTCRRGSAARGDPVGWRCRPGRPSAAARPRPGRPGADQASTRTIAPSGGSVTEVPSMAPWRPGSSSRRSPAVAPGRSSRCRLVAGVDRDDRTMAFGLRSIATPAPAGRDRPRPAPAQRDVRPPRVDGRPYERPRRDRVGARAAPAGG